MVVTVQSIVKQCQPESLYPAQGGRTVRAGGGEEAGTVVLLRGRESLYRVGSIDGTRFPSQH